MRVGDVVQYLLVPGVVLHELAHASVATVLPGISVTEVDLTSHVRHRGRYTVVTSVLVAYAPLLVNTGVAVWALFRLARLDPTDSARHLGLMIGLGYVALVAGLTAIPSVTDVLSPLRIWWQQFPSVRGLLALPVLPGLILVSLPWLLIASARRRSLVAYVGLSGLYTTVIVLVAVDVIAVPAPGVALEQAIEAFRQARAEQDDAAVRAVGWS